MDIHLQISPLNIIPWLSDEERNSSIVLLDFSADIENDKTLRLDLNVVFNPISVRRGIVNRVDYYVGSTGAEISIEATKGTIRDYTREATLNVKYSNTTKKQRQTTLTLTPIVKMKHGAKEIDAKPGVITQRASHENSFTVTFTSEERILSTSLMHDTIKWTIAEPRGAKAIRDFLIGNLYLFAKCTWLCSQRAGFVIVRPSDVLFFDASRQPLSKIASIFMQYILWEKGIKLSNTDGFRTEFEELSNE